MSNMPNIHLQLEIAKLLVGGEMPVTISVKNAAQPMA